MNRESWKEETTSQNNGERATDLGVRSSSSSSNVSSRN